jgi:hypothetical protein
MEKSAEKDYKAKALTLYPKVNKKTWRRGTRFLDPHFRKLFWMWVGEAGLAAGQAGERWLP